MAPPSTKPKLAALDPTAVADAVCQQVADHVSRLATQLWGGCTPQSGLVVGTLHAEVQALVQWAQTGRAWDWEDSGDAWDAASQIVSALYGSAAGNEDLGDLIGDADPETPIGIVLVATHCRVRIAQRESVTARQVAALAGLSARQVRQIVEDGELTMEGGEIEAREAKRFLRARGIQGL
jgi:hypothetical protein